MLRSLCFSGVYACWGALVMSPLQTKDDKPMARLRGNRRSQKVRKRRVPFLGGLLGSQPNCPYQGCSRGRVAVLETRTCSKSKGRSHPSLVTKDQPPSYREAQKGA